MGRSGGENKIPHSSGRFVFGDTAKSSSEELSREEPSRTHPNPTSAVFEEILVDSASETITPRVSGPVSRSAAESTENDLRESFTSFLANTSGKLGMVGLLVILIKLTTGVNFIANVPYQSNPMPSDPAVLQTTNPTKPTMPDIASTANCSSESRCLIVSACKSQKARRIALAQIQHAKSNETDTFKWCFKTWGKPMIKFHKGRFYGLKQCENEPPDEFFDVPCEEESRQELEPMLQKDLNMTFEEHSCILSGIWIPASLPRERLPHLKYLFYSGHNVEPVVLSWEPDDGIFFPNVTEALAGKLDEKKKLIFLAHGFRQSPRDEGPKHLLRAIQLRFDRPNVIVIDWSNKDRLEALHYSQTAGDIYPIAKLNSMLLRKIRENFPGLKPKNLIFVGFSLGAQMGGQTTRTFQIDSGEIFGRLIALDPAAPCFCEHGISPKSGDAGLVEVFHTNAHMDWYQVLSFGCNIPGDRSYYVNGGWSQPGCRSLNLFQYSRCDHSRAQYVLADHLSDETCSLKGKLCSTTEEHLSERCNSSVTLMLLKENRSIKSPARIFMKTNEEQPFCSI